jgi:selenoprotein W-related protein
VKAATGIECELIKGGGGIFDVIADGKKIYSKHDTGVFPEHDEVISQLNSK